MKEVSNDVWSVPLNLLHTHMIFATDALSVSTIDVWKKVYEKLFLKVSRVSIELSRQYEE